MAISESLKERVNRAGKKIPMSLIKGVATEGDSPYWFSSGAKSFFKSKYPEYAYRKGNKAFFITQETNPSGETRSSIRVINLNTGNIDTVGDFHAYSKATAKEKLKELF